MDRANAKARHGRIQVLVNNSDGLGNSYGSHLNFLLSRDAWENIFHRKPHQLAYLASYQASSIVVAGQGKVGAENDAPAAAYQISQRADFFETLTGGQTTFDRPLVNSRDEALCATRGYMRHDGAAQYRFRPAALHLLRQQFVPRGLPAQGRRHADRAGHARSRPRQPRAHPR